MDSGKIVNHISTDAQNIAMSMTFLHNVWAAPLKIFIAIGLVVNELGVAALVGVVVLLVLIPANYVLAAKMGKFQKMGLGMVVCIICFLSSVWHFWSQLIWHKMIFCYKSRNILAVLFELFIANGQKIHYIPLLYDSYFICNFSTTNSSCTRSLIPRYFQLCFSIQLQVSVMIVWKTQMNCYREWNCSNSMLGKNGFVILLKKSVHVKS